MIFWCGGKYRGRKCQTFPNIWPRKASLQYILKWLSDTVDYHKGTETQTESWWNYHGNTTQYRREPWTLWWVMSSWHLKTVLREGPLPLTVGSLVDILGCFNDLYSSLPPHTPCHTHAHTHSKDTHAHILSQWNWLTVHYVSVLYIALHID